jgi:hypothetical protein
VIDTTIDNKLGETGGSKVTKKITSKQSPTVRVQSDMQTFFDAIYRFLDGNRQDKDAFRNIIFDFLSQNVKGPLINFLET